MSSVINPAPFLEVSLREATEHSVQLVIRNVPHGSRDSTPIVRFSGTVYGPVLKRPYSRTLPAKYTLMPKREGDSPQREAVATIPDPCYWAPDSPMHYAVQLDLELADGAKLDWGRSTGLRRLEAHGPSLYSNGKRIVLRGSTVGSIGEAEIQTAQRTHSTLLIHEPSVARLRDANELGVNLIVDLRGIRGDLTAWLIDLTWHPSAAIVVLDDDAEVSYRPERLLYAQSINVARSSPQSIATWADVLAFELGPGDRPPGWVATCGKPIIAIRRGQPYADIYYARRVADYMQAELAPQHDLSGYIAAEFTSRDDEQRVNDAVRHRLVRTNTHER
jgi:hypothetical protein